MKVAHNHRSMVSYVGVGYLPTDLLGISLRTSQLPEYPRAKASFQKGRINLFLVSLLKVQLIPTNGLLANS